MPFQPTRKVQYPHLFSEEPEPVTLLPLTPSDTEIKGGTPQAEHIDMSSVVETIDEYRMPGGLSIFPAPIYIQVSGIPSRQRLQVADQITDLLSKTFVVQSQTLPDGTVLPYNPEPLRIGESFPENVSLACRVMANVTAKRRAFDQISLAGIEALALREVGLLALDEGLIKNRCVVQVGGTLDADVIYRSCNESIHSFFTKLVGTINILPAHLRVLCLPSYEEYASWLVAAHHPVAFSIVDLTPEEFNHVSAQYRPDESAHYDRETGLITLDVTRSDTEIRNDLRHGLTLFFQDLIETILQEEETAKNILSAVDSQDTASDGEQEG